MNANCPQSSVPQTEIQTERSGHVGVWWFPRDFSQSRYGERNTGSNACTLIAILVAQKCYEKEIKIWGHDEQPLNKELICALGDSILEGEYHIETQHNKQYNLYRHIN